MSSFIDELDKKKSSSIMWPLRNAETELMEKIEKRNI